MTDRNRTFYSQSGKVEFTIKGSEDNERVEGISINIDGEMTSDSLIELNEMVFNLFALVSKRNQNDH